MNDLELNFGSKQKIENLSLFASEGAEAVSELAKKIDGYNDTGTGYVRGTGRIKRSLSGRDQRGTAGSANAR